ncbi:MAG TPA: hypothetical protein VFP21_13165, partial [Solirubrobacterales bacterium]|nr:hypothetical protein [Solirubrobacterales bacterium]
MPSRAQRRRRLLVPLAVLLILVFATVRIMGGSGSSGGTDPAPSATAPPKTLVARASKPLPAPIAGESAVAVPGGALILGGLDAGESSVGGVFLRSPSGRLSAAGSLSEPLHDAAATVLGGRVLVFGGGTETSTDVVQELPAEASPQATATVVGHLPAVRSDLSAVTIGSRAYVLGGYDGSTPDPAVLATADGSSFSRVAELKVPARYLATAALGGRIFTFGGETASGEATDAIQEVDSARGTARVVGHMPQAVSHAAAVVLGSSIYVLGGETNGVATDKAWRFDPGSHKLSPAPPLPRPVADGAAVSDGEAAYLVGGTGAGGETLDTVVSLRLRPAKPAPQSAAEPEGGTSAAAEKTAGGHAPPFEGELMIADRGNNRIIVVNNRKRVLWRYPSKAHPAPPGGFYFPDDAFFTHGGSQIISNEEENERIVQLSYPGGKLLWSYGHAGEIGSE